MNTKTFLCTTIAVATAVFTGAATAAVKDGTFEGSGIGRGGPIQVAVTFAKGKIANVKVVKQTETVGVSDPALKAVPANIVKAN
ncbi:MAG: FMN-binding protein, partial [Sutterellaceae bacterium]|nr:FMN-binding protein [Sutterellaceae bacterium]